MKNFISNADEPVRMFENPILEKFSRVHVFVPLILYVPAILFGIFLAIFIFKVAVYMVFLYLVLGIFIWTLTEYLLHRFVFHLNFSGERGQQLHRIFHGIHHEYPSDSRRLVMPPSVSLPMAFLAFGIFFLFVGPVLAWPICAGFGIGYLIYDMTHYAVHRYAFKNRYWRALRRNHMRHHFVDPTSCYGVSNPLWDLVFGTQYKSSPKKKAPDT